MNSALNSMLPKMNGLTMMGLGGVGAGAGWMFFIKWLVVLSVIGILVYLCILAFKNSRYTATPDNIKRIQAQQQGLLEPLWTGITLSLIHI